MQRQMRSPTICVEGQSTATDSLPFADGGQIAVVLLRNWLDWVTRNNCDVFVGLPMIQRGSVWEAKKIADLWDSLLQGMPVGSLTVLRYDTKTERTIRTIYDDNAKNEVLPVDNIFVLDGQQRTLAMCIGWPWEKDMDKRVWVDFGQVGVAGQPFRLRVTTQCHPFGFNPADHSKLSRHDRRMARKKFDEDMAGEAKLKSEPDYRLPLAITRPYGAELPLELRSIIRDWRDTGYNLDVWCDRTLAKLSIQADAGKGEIASRLRVFGTALERLFQMQIALVRVAPRLVEQDDADADENTEPPLIVLFNRIANAGSPLSRADYVFSLIKHRFPKAHDLVQRLHAEGNVASLLCANDLVMTAVRFAVNTNLQPDGTAFTDIPTPSPKEFGRILKMKVGPGALDFLEEALKPLIETDSPCSLHRAFQETQRLLTFRQEHQDDPGLPKLAFPLLQRQLVQVVVFWIHRRLLAETSEEALRKQFDNSRTAILRFILFWLLCVENREKEKELAGKIAFKILRESGYELFPDKELYEAICGAKLAVPLQRPESVESAAISPHAPNALIRSNSARFYTKAEDGSESESQPLYRRWFFRKDLLLWLQRETLVVEFADANPLAGREDETPYDFDHICPWADWGSDYRSTNFPLKHFCERQEAGIVGNCIGNYRVEESSSNRRHGDESAMSKLGLAELHSLKTQTILKSSAITMGEAANWRACYAAKDDQGEWSQQGVWDNQRALAFQKAVEERAFRLFKQYFREGGFDQWVSPLSQEDNAQFEIRNTPEKSGG
jgi:hypothetical protein